VPSEYKAKKPRGSKFKNTPVEDRARAAIARASEIRAARFRCATAGVKLELRHTPQNHIVEILCGYMQIDEIEMILADLKAKRKHAHALAAENRHRQAS
jgi:hypothetical protein